LSKKNSKRDHRIELRMFTMRAAVYEEFSTPLTIKNVPDPTPEDDGVVLEVKATGGLS
jgi:hypothetical protein